MKLSMRHIKSALDFSTTRTAVSDLVKSGKRSVRVITEEQVLQLIQVIVEDAFANSGHVAPEEREKVVAAAKERFDSVMEQQAETEARNKRQEEVILSLQQRITQLVNEKQELSAAQRQLEQHLDAALRHAQMAAQQPAGVPVADGTPEALSRMANELAQVQQWLSRMESKGASSANASNAMTTDVDAKLEASVQKLIDRFGRTVANATAKPIESRVMATDALLGKVLDGGGGTESNIGDLDVEERMAEGNIERSLDRLRRTQKRPASAAKPAPDPSKDQTATEDRRQGEPDRRQAPPTNNGTAEERREGPQDRRSD